MALLFGTRILSSSTRNILALTEMLRPQLIGAKNLLRHETCNQYRCFGITPRKLQNEVTINFVERDGETISVKAKLGETLLDVAKDNDISLEVGLNRSFKSFITKSTLRSGGDVCYGACEGTLACSTCHLIFKPEICETLPEPTDEELDMLDLAFGLTDTSRLGCQITITPEMDNMTVEVPKESFDVRQ